MHNPPPIRSQPTGLPGFLEQISFLIYETNAINNRRWYRWLSCWFTTKFWVIASYRFSRAMYLLFGRGWQAARVLLSPLIFLLKPWIGTTEIHYQAQIGKGLNVLHPSLGVMVSRYAAIGENLTLTGGNCIGSKKRLSRREIILGDNIILGANAVILGPVRVGSNVVIGAGAVVVSDAPDGAVLLGVPAVNVAGAEPAAGQTSVV